jgi:hypothetical protein
LRKSVLAGGAIKYEQHLNRAGWGNFGHHAADLGQFIHQARSSLHATGGINDYRSEGARGGQGQRIVNGGGRIAAWSTLHHFNPFAEAERTQLIDCCCAERVGCDKEWCEPSAFRTSGEFGSGGGLSNPVDTNEKHHIGLLLLIG